MCVCVYFYNTHAYIKKKEGESYIESYRRIRWTAEKEKEIKTRIYLKASVYERESNIEKLREGLCMWMCVVDGVLITRKHILNKLDTMVTV